MGLKAYKSKVNILFVQIPSRSSQLVSNKQLKMQNKNIVPSWEGSASHHHCDLEEKHSFSKVQNIPSETLCTQGSWSIHWMHSSKGYEQCHVDKASVTASLVFFIPSIAFPIHPF